MIRILFALLMVIGLAAPAYAEINTDTGCDSSGSWMVETGWSVSGSKCVGSNVRSEKMLMQMNSAIKKGHKYRVTFTVSGYSGTGSVRAFVGITMPSSPAGSWITAASLTPIADRFTLGIGTGLVVGGDDFSVPPFNLTGPGNSAEDIGSMRIFCTHANFGMVDPLLLPGLSGVGHIHEFAGNTAVNENTTYQTLRTQGATSCMDATGDNAQYPANPTAYWWPAVMDGLGHVIRENQTLVYYKGPSKPGLNYSGHSPYGGTATTNGTATITRSTGAAFTTLTVGQTLWVGSESFTVASITDADHLVLSGTSAAGTKIYDLFSPNLKSEAGFLCNESFGQDDITHDQLGNVVTDETRCPQIPHGMKYIFGYNKANGQGRPDRAPDTTSGDNGTGAVSSGTQGIIDYTCFAAYPSLVRLDHPGVGGRGYDTLADIMASGECPVGSQLHIGLGGPQCWDGVHIDSPDHRAHMAYALRATAHVGNSRCPASHPYRLPQMSVQNWYTVDQAFTEGKWRLSVDEMVDGLPAGAGAHMDYWWAWSPTASDLWFTNCYHPHNSCTNDLGNGTQIPGPKSYDGSSQFCNGCAKDRPDRYVSVKDYGMSWDYTANGTYTVDLTSPGDGVFGFMGLSGFNGSIDDIQVVEISTGGKGPVTVTGGGAL